MEPIAVCNKPPVEHCFSTMSTLLAVIRRAGEENLLLVEQFLAREGARLVAEDGEEA